ncbi:hypothetical protein OIU78_023106 [Salix suchowensis]|nr:hypothetical protein OIU78_023106 [Salix suchowensis]
MIIIYVLFPKRLVFFHPNFQPWLGVSIEVQNCSLSLSSEDQHLYSPIPTHAMRDLMALLAHRKSKVQEVVSQVSTVSDPHSFLASSGRFQLHFASSTQPNQKHSFQMPNHTHQDQNVL